MDKSRRTNNIGRKAFRKEGSALHLVRYEGHTLLWAVGIGWNSCGLLATPINLLESRIEIEMPIYWQSYEIVAWQRQTTHCFQHKRHYNKSWLECLAVPLRIHQTLLLTSDYHLFRSMQHTLSNTHFQSVDKIQKWLDNFIVSKDTAFFRDGIHQLPESYKKQRRIYIFIKKFVLKSFF